MYILQFPLKKESTANRIKHSVIFTLHVIKEFFFKL